MRKVMLLFKGRYYDMYLIPYCYYYI